MYHINICTWDNGAPVVVRRIDGFLTKEEGVTRLRNIRHSWDYNIDYVGRLLDHNDVEVARLDIHRHTYGVVEIDSSNESSGVE